MRPMNNSQLCSCKSGKDYKICCHPYIEKTIDTPNAEALMRSRYTAFVQMNEIYLRYSWHPETCPNNLNLDKKIKWLGLKITPQIAKKIKNTTDAHENTVEFVVRYKINGKAFRLHEISLFTQYLGRWVYLRQA